MPMQRNTYLCKVFLWCFYFCVWRGITCTKGKVLTTSTTQHTQTQQKKVSFSLGDDGNDDAIYLLVYSVYSIPRTTTTSRSQQPITLPYPKRYNFLLVLPPPSYKWNVLKVFRSTIFIQPSLKYRYLNLTKIP